MRRLLIAGILILFPTVAWGSGWPTLPGPGYQLAATCTPTESPETSCSDTIDNDCDGLVDGADSDCGAPPVPIFDSGGFESPTYTVGEVGGQDGWVENTASASKFIISTTTPYAGTQSLAIVYSPTPTNAERIISTQTETFVVDFWLTHSDASSGGGRIGLSNGDSVATTNHGPFLGINSGNIQAFNGSTWNTISSISSSTPTHIEVQVNTASSNMTIWVNETSMGTFSFRNSITTLDRFFVSNFGTSVTFFIDNLIINPGTR